jgi:hypothetical protein
MATHSFKSRRFQSLRWKLTLSYLGVTVAALLTVELLLLSGLGFGLVTLIKSGFLPEQIIQAATTSRVLPSGWNGSVLLPASISR